MRRRGLLREIMKKRSVKKQSAKQDAVGRTGVDELLLEYDFSWASRNKYAPRYALGSIVVVLEPEVAAASERLLTG